MWCFFVFITTYGAYNARKSRKIRRCIENVSKKCLLLSLKWSKIWVKVEQSGEKWYKVEDRAETCGVASTFILPSLTTRLSKKRVPQTTEGSWWSLMFMGTYDHSIDAKGRVIVPAKFREELGDSFVVWWAKSRSGAKNAGQKTMTLITWTILQNICRIWDFPSNQAVHRRGRRKRWNLNMFPYYLTNALKDWQ